MILFVLKVKRAFHDQSYRRHTINHRLLKDRMIHLKPEKEKPVLMEKLKKNKTKYLC